MPLTDVSISKFVVPSHFLAGTFAREGNTSSVQVGNEASPTPGQIRPSIGVLSTQKFKLKLSKKQVKVLQKIIWYQNAYQIAYNLVPLSDFLLLLASIFSLESCAWFV